MNDDLRYACSVIRSVVSPLDVGKLLGMDPGNDGRCKCPFHNGDHRNLKLYGPGQGYYCFVCHVSGDVISLVKEYTQCSFYEAVEFLSEAYNLNLYTDRSNPWSRARRADAYMRSRRQHAKNP